MEKVIPKLAFALVNHNVHDVNHTRIIYISQVIGRAEYGESVLQLEKSQNSLSLAEKSTRRGFRGTVAVFSIWKPTIEDEYSETRKLISLHGTLCSPISQI